MKGIIKNGLFIYDDEEYQLVSRIATVGEFIITTPYIYDFYSNLHKGKNNISFYEPYEVVDSLRTFVCFKNEHSISNTYLSNDGEYCVVCKIPKTRVKIGEDVVSKTFLGITLYKKVIEKYSLEG